MFFLTKFVEHFGMSKRQKTAKHGKKRQKTPKTSKNFKKLQKTSKTAKTFI